MKKIEPYIGVAVIAVGVLVLAATRIAALSSSNTLLLTGLLLIVAGIWLHIRTIKKESQPD